MKKLSKKILVVLCALLLLAGLAVSASAAQINVGKGIYTPAWGEEWTTPETEGIWQGFYINKSDNTLRVDLIKKAPGQWTAPGSQYACVWEGCTNIVSPSDDCDVGYILNAVEGGKIEITLKGFLEVAGCTEVTFGIYKNNFNNLIWPTNGSEMTVNHGDIVDVSAVVDVAKGDKLFYKWHSPVEVANSPNFRFQVNQVVWRSSDQQQTTPSVDAPQGGNDTTTTTTTAPQGGTDTTTTAPQGGDNSGGIIIDTDDSYYLTSKYEDVTVDEENDKVTLTKKLTLKDFMESFTVKMNHTIKVIDTETTQEVTDNDTVITDTMICRVFNQGTPITNIAIETTYETDAPGETGEGLPVWAIILIVVGAVVVVAAVVVAVLFILKKKQAPAAE